MVFRRIQSDRRRGFTSFHKWKVYTKLRKIVTLAYDVAFEEVITDDVVQLLVPRRENIWRGIDVVRTKVSRGYKWGYGNSINSLKLIAKSIAKALSLMQENLQVFDDKSSNHERNITITILYNALSSYTELCKQMMCPKHRTILDRFFPTQDVDEDSVPHFLSNSHSTITISHFEANIFFPSECTIAL